jgi:osmotically-inducible protein OsmY
MYLQLLIAYSILPLFLTGELHSGLHVQNSQVIAEIEDHLYHANVLKHGQVQVAFADGVATLTGTVDSIGVKTDAETATWKDEDVSRVVNQIVIAGRGADASQIVHDARRKILNYYANSIFDQVDIDAQGNTLMVSGQVTQPYKKEAIGNFLAHIRGVAAVENRIQVLPLSVDDEDTRMRIARAIYDDPYFASYAEVANPSIHIIVNAGNVRLVGTVDSDVDRSRAQQDARSVATYVVVQNDLRIVARGTTP